MWARNDENIAQLREIKRNVVGVYILYDGSMPVYVGKGDIKERIRLHKKSKTKGQLWDHFSWYVLCNPELLHDVESIILRMLPPYLRSLTKQKGKLTGVKKTRQREDIADVITRKVVR